MYDPKRCADCKYSMMFDNTPICGYILIVGHSRNRGKYEGKKCPKYEQRTKKRKTAISLEEGFTHYDLYE